MRPSKKVYMLKAAFSFLALSIFSSVASGQADSVRSVITRSSDGWTKTCYVGSPQCSGGVGSNAPLGTPAMRFGMSESSGAGAASSAVAHFQMVDPNPDVYTEVLYVNTIGKADRALYFTRDFYEKFLPPAGTTNLEWDLYQFSQPDGLDAMLGTQCNSKNHRIQYDNQGHGWVDTKVSCSTMMDGNWHHVHQTLHRDTSDSTSCSDMPCEHWDTIQIDDGPVNNINVTLPMTRTHWHAFGAQWQIDGRPNNASRSNPAVYDLYVDNDTITASSTPPSE
jgi:hypothetical protein